MKANRTGLLSSSLGAVMVLPTRLPKPFASVNRYQVNACRFQASDQHTAGPVRRLGDMRFCTGYDSREGLILRDLDMQFVHEVAIFGRTASPQQNTVVVGIAGRDPFRVKIPALLPGTVRSSAKRLSPYCGSAESNCRLNEGSSGSRSHWFTVETAACVLPRHYFLRGSFEGPRLFCSKDESQRQYCLNLFD